MKLFKHLLCGTLIAALLLPAAAAVSTDGSFSDIQGHWAQKEIEAAVREGWVDGYPDGTFRPEATITQAEFTKMLLAANHLTPGSKTAEWLKGHTFTMNSNYDCVRYTPKFTDMGNHWLTKQGWTEVSIASGFLVPEDYPKQIFHPNTPIYRYSIAVMTDRAMGLVLPSMQPLAEPLTFTDQAQIQDWAKGYVKQATSAGVLKGYPDGSFGPKRTATRAEAVVMVFRQLQYNRGDGPATINVRLNFDNWERATEKIPLTTVSGRLYASYNDIINEIGDLCVEKGFSETPTDGFPTQWYPIEQEIGLLWNRPNWYQAGNTYYVNETSYQRFPGNLSSPFTSNQFSAPVRMLDGELMLPVYDFNLPTDTNYLATYDNATNTLTLYFSYPDPFMS